MSQRVQRPAAAEPTSLCGDPALPRVLADEARRVHARTSPLIPVVFGLRLRGVGRRPGRLQPRLAS